MNTLVLLALGVAAAMWFAQSAAAQAYTPGSGLAGSPHDITTAGDGGTGVGVTPDGKICIACHTPHNGTSTLAPLWNHAAGGGGHTPYTSGTIDAGDLGAPGGVSLMCLSCHDGSTAIDSFGSTTGTVLIVGNALLDTDLQDDHPVSFTYNAGLASSDGGLNDPTGTSSGLPAGGNIDDDMLFGAGNDQMECSSCHEVHNETNTVAKLLLKANTASALCFTCHNK
jgi:predicted CXXCH cytochrome family protein